MTKTQKAIDACLAVLLIALICVFSFKTIWPNRKELYDSARLMSRLKKYMPEEHDASDLLTARIDSFEAKFNDVMWKKDELGYLNSTFQYALNKDLVTTGASSMVTLGTGDLYDLPTYKDTSAQTDEIIEFAENAGVPVLFIYEHPTTYPGNMPTGGYAVLDSGTRMSDEIVSALRAGGVEVLDSRDILAGYGTDEIVMRTDQHWTTLAALTVTCAIAENIGMDAERLDITKFDSRTYPEKFLGKYGQKVGPDNVRPDDITIYWPICDTYIERTTLNNGVTEEVSGAFYDSVIKWENLEGDGWNIDAYRDYGLTEDLEHFHNDDGDMTILLFKDSYSAPVGAFLSLVAKDVYTVDMRKADQPAQYFVDKYQPDRIIMAYSRQMLCDNEYDLIEGY